MGLTQSERQEDAKMNMKDMCNTNLEALVDEYDLRTVVDALSCICFEKAEHVQTNWQDTGLAAKWEHNAKALDKVRAKLLV